MWKTFTKWLKRALVLVLIYALLFVGVFAWQMVSHRLSDPDADLVDDTQEGIGNRRTDNAAIIESVREFVTKYRTPEYERDAHSKPHGCVRATFKVFDTQSKYNYGIFKEEKTYEAWIRFSNGSVPVLDDPKKDARGMAIKVMGVPGEQLLPPLLAGTTQDFVMINSPAFFIRKISDYRKLEELTTLGKPFTYFLGPHYLNPFKWKLRELYLGLGTRKKAPATPLSTQYFSMTPYRLGPHEMKYSAKACENYQAPGVNRDDPNFLREAMKQVLKNQDACFEFMVQLRDPDARMPIQDTTVVWSEKKSPFVQLGRVHIPPQEFDTPEQNAMCEALSFNVWHGVKELQPLSYINELRRDLYLHTAAYRNVRNGAKTGEPKSWCDSLPSYCDDETDPSPTAAEATEIRTESEAIDLESDGTAADNVETEQPTADAEANNNL